MLVVLTTSLIIAQLGGYHMTSSFLSYIHNFCFVSFASFFKEVLSEWIISKLFNTVGTYFLRQWWVSSQASAA